ncbi:cation transporter [Geothrix limicola]|nr:cation transporter [Geothrix limicola]
MTWVRRALALALLTMGFNLLEGLVSIGFGWEEQSIALFGFGVDSLVEVAAAALIYWRFRHDGALLDQQAARRERLATRFIGIMLLLLAGGTALGSILQLLSHRHPGTTLPGVIVSLVSLLAMFLLWRGKVRTAAALDSRAMMSDAACSLACMQLSTVLLIGSLLFWRWPSLWWVDAATALVVAALIAREGWGGFHASLQPDFSGGCGCGHANCDASGRTGTN